MKGNDRCSSLIIYLVGLLPLAVFYEPVKHWLGGGVLFFSSVVVYLAALRLVAWLASRKQDNVKTSVDV